ncbi:MAG: chloramphenicol acetyltransferase [Longimonas sp.]|uniref:CatA-like O-acetyltransferase n=1 Tax=Longimonas sp. TaxID=2039626 RepID=UPI003976D447
MKQQLDLDAWPRKDHFEFFQSFDEPFFGVCVDVDCSHAYAHCKEEEQSFFLFYLHKALAAANRVEPFRLRIEGDDVYLHDRVHVSFTVDRPDGTFGFAYTEYHERWPTFAAAGQAEMERVRAGTDLTPTSSGENVILVTSLPWLDFSAFSHARHFGFEDSAPKMAFGKMTEAPDGTRSMPVSIHVHHALVDGRHVGEFVDAFQQLMDNTQPD